MGQELRVSQATCRQSLLSHLTKYRNVGQLSILSVPPSLCLQTVLVPVPTAQAVKGKHTSEQTQYVCKGAWHTLKAV